jgi:Tfp pilus assembly protein PilF
MDAAETAFRHANKLNSADGDTRQNLGVVLFKKRNFDEAKSFFQPMDGDGGVAVTVEGKRNLAAAASRAGDYRTAIPLWSEILKSDKSDQEVRLLLADAMFNTGDAKAALTMYKEILSAKGNSAAAMDGIGRCHIKNASYAAAEASLRSAIKADKSFVPAYNNLAVVLEKMNKRSEAIGYLEMAARMDENNTDVQKNLRRMRSAG